MRVDDNTCKLPAGWTRMVHTRAMGSSKGKRSVMLISPTGRRFDRRSTLAKYLQSQGLSYDENVFSFNLHSPIKTITPPFSPGNTKSPKFKKEQVLNIKSKLAASPTTASPKEGTIDKDLRHGWKKRTRVRTAGVSAGRSDTCYISPEGLKIRSKPEVAKYLKSCGSKIKLKDIFKELPSFKTAKSKSTALSRDKTSAKLSPTSIKKSPIKAAISLNADGSNLQEARPDMMFVDPNLPAGWKREIHIRKSGDSIGRIEVYIISPDGKKITNKTKLKRYLELQNLSYSPSDFDFTCYGRQRSKSSSNVRTHVVAVKPKIKKTKEAKQEAQDLLSYLNLREAKQDSIPADPIDVYKSIASRCCSNDHRFLYYTAEKTFAESVRALALACRVPTRTERRFSSAVALPPSTIPLHTFSGDETHVPTGWVKSIISSRTELSHFDNSALEQICRATEDFLRQLAARTLELGQLKGTGESVEYKHLSRLMTMLPSLEPFTLLVPQKIPVSHCRKLAHPTRFFSFTL